MTDTPTDAELVRRLRSDPGAFETLYRRYVRRVVMYAARRCSHPRDVADLVARTFIAALGSAERYDPARGEVLPWLLGNARHLRADSTRRTQWEAEVHAEAPPWCLLDPDEIAELQARIDAARESDVLEAAMGRLRTGQREALWMVGYLRLSNAEAAQVLEMPATAFRVRLIRAHRALGKASAQLDDGGAMPLTGADDELSPVEFRLLSELLVLHPQFANEAAGRPGSPAQPRFKQPRSRSESIQNALLSAAILALLVVLVRHVIVGSKADFAATPPPLVYQPPLPPSGRQVLLQLAANAATQPVTPRPAGTPYAYVSEREWHLAVQRGDEPAPTRVFPTSIQSWLERDGAGRVLEVSRARSEDMTVGAGNPLPALSRSETALARQLAVGQTPVGEFEALIALASREPISPQVESVLLRLLARLPGLINSGTVIDRARAPGVAVSLESASGGVLTAYTLIFDASSGSSAGCRADAPRHPQAPRPAAGFGGGLHDVPRVGVYRQHDHPALNRT